MKKTSYLLRVLALCLSLLLCASLLFACGGDENGGEPDIDTDGDGIPDHLDKETEDGLGGDNEVKVEDFFR